MKTRIVGYDLARALAVFGMVVVNFKIVMGAEHNGPEWLVTLVGLLNGRAAAIFVVLAGVGLSLFFNGFHPVVPWLAFLLVGMVIGRLEMNEARTRRGVFISGASVALAAEGLSRVLIHLLSSGAGPADREVIAAVFGTGPMPPMPLYILAGAGSAAAVIAAMVELGSRYGQAKWMRPFVATGQLALSLYVAHVVVGMGLLEGLGRLENQTLPFAVAAALVFCAAGVVFAFLWRRRFKRGPLEAIMRTLS